MPDHLEKVLAHAEDQLSPEGRERPRDQIDLYRKFLKLEEHRLLIHHNAGGGGREIACKRADLVDIVLRHIFNSACHACKFPEERRVTRLALVALGGYGRGELNPHSDIDVMFLHDAPGNRMPRDTNDVIEQVLYMLWDIGFKVGHSTRAPGAAIEQANNDFLSKTSLLEARFICGENELFGEFQETFTRKCVRGHEERYIEWRVANQRERHDKYGNTVFLQEPNIKNGVGGLRDYQNLVWITYFKEGVIGNENLVERGILRVEERKRLEKAYDFLLRVRTDLHYQHGRPTDILTLYYQGQIANNFNYPQRNILRRSEEFMRDYYRHSRNIDRITNTVANRLALTLDRGKPPPIFSFLARRQSEREHFDGFYSENGLVFRERRDIFKEDPFRIIRVFLHAQNRQLELSPNLQQYIRRRVRIVDRTFQYSRAARDIFSTILQRKGQVGRILRMMHEVDFLGAYIPEFGALDCLVQHEFYHRYTADEHTLRVVEKLDTLIDTEDPKLRGYRALFEKLDNPYVLYLAILLHDTGRATDAKYHEEASSIFAQKVARRLQLDPGQRRQLILLVDNHTQLSTTAQRRNLDDMATVEEFAVIVNDLRNLDALMLLTLADGMGTTGENTWSDWKESLVWKLYRSTRGFLENGATFFEEKQVEKMEIRSAVERRLDVDYGGEIDAHFESMPDVYFHTFSQEEITSHLRLFREFLTHLSRKDPAESLQAAIQWNSNKDSGHSEVLICTWDREALLARIAASFAITGINILSADIYTREDNLVLDVFRICDTDFQAVTHSSDIGKVERTLQRSLTQPGFDFKPLLHEARSGKSSYHLSKEIQFPTRISINNDVHPVYTLVDIQTPDRLGLLYDILQGFAKAEVGIALSRIATEKGGAIDSFYVVDHNGRKIRDNDALTRLQGALMEVTPQ